MSTNVQIFIEIQCLVASHRTSKKTLQIINFPSIFKISHVSDRIIPRWIEKSSAMLTCSSPIWINYFTLTTRRRPLVQTTELEKSKTVLCHQTSYRHPVHRKTGDENWSNEPLQATSQRRGTMVASYFRDRFWWFCRAFQRAFQRVKSVTTGWFRSMNDTWTVASASAFHRGSLRANRCMKLQGKWNAVALFLKCNNLRFDK